MFLRMKTTREKVRNAIRDHKAELCSEWARAASESVHGSRDDRDSARIERECRVIIDALAAVVEGERADFGPVREDLDAVARQRVSDGVTAAETSVFIGHLRGPLSRVVAGGEDQPLLVREWEVVAELLDGLQERLVLAYIEARDRTIQRHQEEVLELSTPVIKLWNGILALPLIGTLDSRRAQLVLETLLSRIAETGARIAIIDITGVPTVDTLVAQNLIKAVTATRLMGAECILSGIRPQIAQTIVQLGVNLSEVETKANLADAFVAALGRFDVQLVPKAKKEERGA